jgi:hypothetical protein
LSNPEDIVISKEVLPELPNDYEETTLGDRRGAKKQYRSSSSSLHVREYDGKFTIHIDRVDPRINPVGHLIKDSPETIAAVATTLYFAKRNFEKRKLSGTHGTTFLNGWIVGGLFASFIALNGIFRILKIILFS